MGVGVGVGVAPCGTGSGRSSIGLPSKSSLQLRFRPEIPNHPRFDFWPLRFFHQRVSRFAGQKLTPTRLSEFDKFWGNLDQVLPKSAKSEAISTKFRRARPNPGRVWPISGEFCGEIDQVRAMSADFWRLRPSWGHFGRQDDDACPRRATRAPLTRGGDVATLQAALEVDGAVGRLAIAERRRDEDRRRLCTCVRGTSTSPNCRWPGFGPCPPGHATPPSFGSRRLATQHRGRSDGF